MSSQRNQGIDLLRYVPVVALSWALGAAADWLVSAPCDRALRRRWLRAAPVVLEPEDADASAR